MKNIIYLIPLLISLFCIACEEEDPLETIDELTIQAFLHAGQVVDTVTFGRVIPLDSAEMLSTPTNLLPIISTGEEELFTLFYSGFEGVYNNPDLLIQEDQTYALEVDYNGKLVRAETYIPSKPTNVIISDTLIWRKKLIDFTDLQDQTIPDPIEVSWEGDAEGFYFVNVENIEADPELINELFAGGDRPNRPNFQTEPSNDTFYNIDTFREITHYGTYEVTIYRVNPEYVALYEDNTSGSGALNEIRTNVENGYGIFTGINSEKIYFNVKKF